MKKVFCIAIYWYLKTFKGLNIFDLYKKDSTKFMVYMFFTEIINKSDNITKVKDIGG